MENNFALFQAGYEGVGGGTTLTPDSILQLDKAAKIQSAKLEGTDLAKKDPLVINNLPFPTVGEAPKAVKFSNELARELLVKSGIQPVSVPILLPRLNPVWLFVPKNRGDLEVAESWVNSKLAIEGDGVKEGGKVRRVFQVMMPYPDINQLDVAASYRPSYHAYLYDKGILMDIKDQVASKHSVTDASERERIWRLFYTAAEGSYYGNGSMQGQLGRHIECLKVRKSREQNAGTWAAKDLEDFRNFLVTHRKYVKMDMGEVGTDMLRNVGEGTVKIVVNRNSDPGPVWQSGKKKLKNRDVLQASLNFATDILNKFAECVNKGMSIDDMLTPKPGAPAPLAFLRLVMWKPKDEVYEIAEFKTKTRNICAPTFSAHIPFQVVMNAVKPPPATANDLVLLGFSMWHGGLNRLLVNMAAEARGLKEGPVNIPGWSVRVYSDNLYICWVAGEKVYFASLDGSKMEASCTLQLVKITNALTVLHCDNLNPIIKEYVYKLHPHLVVSTVALWGNQQFPIGWLASGAVGTADYNSNLMCDVVRRTVPLVAASEQPILVTKAGPKLNTALWKASERAGVVLKVEKVVCLSDKEDYTDLDFLGFAGRRMLVGGKSIMVPILKNERLANTTLFHKKFNDDDAPDLGDRAKFLLNSMYKLLKYRMLYLIGGWANPILRLVLYRSCKRYYNAIRDYGPGALVEARDLIIEQNLEDSSSQIGVFDAAMEVALGVHYSVPTYYELFSLLMDNGHATELVEELIQKQGGWKKDNWRPYAPFSYMEKNHPDIVEQETQSSWADEMENLDEAKREFAREYKPLELPVGLQHLGPVVEKINLVPSDKMSKPTTGTVSADPYRGAFVRAPRAISGAEESIFLRKFNKWVGEHIAYYSPRRDTRYQGEGEVPKQLAIHLLAAEVGALIGGDARGIASAIVASGRLVVFYNNKKDISGMLEAGLKVTNGPWGTSVDPTPLGEDTIIGPLEEYSGTLWTRRTKV